MQNIALLILAAGAASRMGEVKQLLPYKGTTLLEWSIKQAKKSLVKNVFCVLGAHKEIIEKQLVTHTVDIIYNPNYKDGLSTSIVCGIKTIQEKGFDKALIMLADQPSITPTYLNELILNAKNNPTQIIASRYQNTIGVPAIFPKKYFCNLLTLKGDKGAKELLQKEHKNIVAVNSFLNLVDVDTPNDYQHLIN